LADRWHISRHGAALTLSRACPLRFPVRWDVAAETLLPWPARSLRLAHLVRQDLWRVLRRQRGFAPIVSVASLCQGTRLRAGGRVAGHHDRARLEGRIAALLEDGATRARWMRGARREFSASEGAA